MRRIVAGAELVNLRRPSSMSSSDRLEASKSVESPHSRITFALPRRRFFFIESNHTEEHHRFRVVGTAILDVFEVGHAEHFLTDVNRNSWRRASFSLFFFSNSSELLERIFFSFVCVCAPHGKKNLSRTTATADRANTTHRPGGRPIKHSLTCSRLFVFSRDE